MFKAFGIDRAEHGPQWTGEALAQGSAIATAARAGGAGESLDSLNPFAGDDESEGREAKKEKGGAAADAFGGAGRGFAGALAEATGKSAPSPAAAKAAAPRDRADLGDPWRGRDLDSRRSRPRGGQFMKKIFVRHATLSSDRSPAVPADKLTQARAAVLGAPDERSKHKDLARLLALSGQLDELQETLEKWSAKDPLDADVIVGRADIAARRGDRDAALRILGGTLAASALTPADAYTVAQAVGRSYDRLGRPEGCSFHVAAASLRATDPEALSQAIACERGQGRAASAERWLVGLKDTQRSAVSAALAKLETQKAEAATGDVVVAATWTGGSDLDIALVDPSGRRAGAVTRMKGARVEGATARDHETVALASNDAGAFLVEIVRASASEASIPVSGTVTIKALGQTQSIPFTLSGARAQVGRVDVRWDAELVPVRGDGDLGTTFDGGGPAPFDRGAAASALDSVRVSQCGASGQVGTGHATITFSPGGGVSQVNVDDANFSGTPAGRCVQAAFFNARVSAFTGAPVNVGKPFTVGSR